MSTLSVRAAVAAAESENADAGIVYRTDPFEAALSGSLGAESLRARASPFGVPGAKLRLSRVLPPRPRRRHGQRRAFGRLLSLGGHLKTGHLWTGQNRPFPSQVASETG